MWHRRVPDDRLLVETDCPWLAPVPQRGKTNEPAFVTHTAQFLATLRGQTLEALAERTTDNFHRLFARTASGADELLFVEPVVRFHHSHRVVRRLRAGVLPFDVQPQPATFAVGPCSTSHVFVQRRVHAFPAVLRRDVHALNPPEPAVAPIAPFERQHQRAGRFAVRVVGDEVIAIGGPIEQRRQYRPLVSQVERLVLALLRHRVVEADQQIDVGPGGRADAVSHEISFRCQKVENGP